MYNRSSHNNFSTEDIKSSIKQPDYSTSQSTEAKKAANLTGKSSIIKITSVDHSKPNDSCLVNPFGMCSSGSWTTVTMSKGH